MPKVAAIILQQNTTPSRACAETLALQSHALHHTATCQYNTAGNAVEAINCALQHAFNVQKADFVWILPADATPAQDCLEQLLQADNDNIIRTAVIRCGEADNLPYPIPMTDGSHLYKTEQLPQTGTFVCGGAWFGALYPRAAYHKIGALNHALVAYGEGEEYAARAAAAGFSFCAVSGAAISVATTPACVLHYKIGPYSYFYQCGLSRKERYYTMRNWAWIQRVQYPRHYLRRLIACGFYILFTLRAMLQANEVSIPRIYTIFRGLHNGFYGKLRPFSKNKNKKIS